MKRILKIGSFLIAMLCVVSATQAQKFGYVSSSAILADMPDVKQAEANLEALQRQLQKKGQGMVEQLQKDYVEIQQKIERGELSPKQQEEEGNKLKTREAEIGKFEQEMVAQIQDKRAELLKPIYDNINEAIAAVAKEKGYQFIFEEGILLYSEESQNVSALVRAKLNMSPDKP